jgi:hypothetical protein
VDRRDFQQPKHAGLSGYWGLGFGVIDDDPPLIVPASPDAPGAAVEGDSGPQSLDVPVALSQPSTQTVTVDWRTVPFNLDEPPTATEGWTTSPVAAP